MRTRTALIVVAWVMGCAALVKIDAAARHLDAQLSRIEQAQRETRLQAAMANTVVAYWLPPISATRLSGQCGRCHY